MGGGAIYDRAQRHFRAQRGKDAAVMRPVLRGGGARSHSLWGAAQVLASLRQRTG